MSQRLRLISVLLLCVPATASAQGTAIDHGQIACVVAGQFPRIDAKIGQAEQVARARTFFHADDDPRWYYVEMQAVEGVFQGVLPKPLKTTKSLHYYIETTDKGMAQNRTAEYVPEVVAEAGACSRKGAVAAVAIATKIAVAAPSGAATVPAGFAPSSVAAAGGIGGTALLVGGLAVAGGAAALAVAAKAGGDDSKSCDDFKVALDNASIPSGTAIRLAESRSLALQFSVTTTLPTQPGHTLTAILATATGQNCYSATSSSFSSGACQPAGISVNLTLDDRTTRSPFVCQPPFTITQVLTSVNGPTVSRTLGGPFPLGPYNILP